MSLLIPVILGSVRSDRQGIKAARVHIVMGERAMSEKANEQDMAGMKRELEDGIRAGAGNQLTQTARWCCPTRRDWSEC